MARNRLQSVLESLRHTKRNQTEMRRGVGSQNSSNTLLACLPLYSTEHQRLNTWQGTQECVAEIVKYGVKGNTTNLAGAKTTGGVVRSGYRK
jgi:hypothetical protein